MQIPSRQKLLLTAILLSCFLILTILRDVEGCRQRSGNARARRTMAVKKKGGSGQKPLMEGHKVKAAMSSGPQHVWSDRIRRPQHQIRPQVVERIRIIERPVYIERPPPQGWRRPYDEPVVQRAGHQHPYERSGHPRYANDRRYERGPEPSRHRWLPIHHEADHAADQGYGASRHEPPVERYADGLRYREPPTYNQEPMNRGEHYES